MNTLFILIFLLSIPLLIVGLIKPSIFKLQSRKSAGLAFGGLFIVSFILFGVTSTPAEEAVVAKNTNASSTVSNEVKAEIKPLSLEDKIRPLAIKTGTTDISYNGIDDEKADPDRPAGSRMITVKLNVVDYYSSNTFYKNTGNLSAKVFQQTFTHDQNIYDVIIWYMADTKDRYGNTSNNAILTYTMDVKTYKKINWTNFDSTKMCDFLKSEGKINGGETGCTTLASIQ